MPLEGREARPAITLDHPYACEGLLVSIGRYRPVIYKDNVLVSLSKICIC